MIQACVRSTTESCTGGVLGVVGGRDSTGVGAWLGRPQPGLGGTPSRWWRSTPSAAFRKALREHLPAAAVSVDPFHPVKLANDVGPRCGRG